MNIETEKFLQWHKQEQDKGLIDIKFFPGHDVDRSTQEDFFRELNLIVAAKEAGKIVERPDVF